MRDILRRRLAGRSCTRNLRVLLLNTEFVPRGTESLEKHQVVRRIEFGVLR